MSGLIWIQTVCKGHQHVTQVGKEFKIPSIFFHATVIVLIKENQIRWCKDGYKGMVEAITENTTYWSMLIIGKGK